MYLGLGSMLIGFVFFVIARWLTVKKQDLSKRHAVLLFDVATILFEGNGMGFFFALLLKRFGFNVSILSVSNSIIILLTSFFMVIGASSLFFFNVKMFKLTHYYSLHSKQDNIKFIDHFCGLPVIASAVWYILYAFFF